MRTTVNLADDVLKQVKEYAESRSLPMGEALSVLVRKALMAPAATHVVNGIRVFSVRKGAPRVTSRKVRELDSEQY